MVMTIDAKGMYYRELNKMIRTAIEEGETEFVLNNINGQDGIANTMNSNEIIIQGMVGDVIGYGMRGGKLMIKSDVGYRVGIHMKEYKTQVPVIVAGGCAGDFYGEYMGGGVMILLGLGANEDKPIAGDCYYAVACTGSWNNWIMRMLEGFTELH
ncbi:MAG: hypothetical protein P1P80_09790 [ANME-2 cluster archaeon]|nr:hypothetical protein [ANME-2 cluster archaeon]